MIEGIMFPSNEQNLMKHVKPAYYAFLQAS
jgi:hypothetical protein